MKANKFHEPVMVREVVKFLNLALLKTQARYIDATVGTGGHSLAICQAKVQVLGIDADPKMLEAAKSRMTQACPRFKLVQGNFRNIDRIAKQAGFGQVDGIVFDLGVSSLHYSLPNRGFSFSQKDSVLDMRLDSREQAVTAAHLLNLLAESQLQKLFGMVMTRRGTVSLVKRVVSRRKVKPIQKVEDLLKVIEKSPRTRAKLDPATLPFLALRLAVNSQLENLKEGLPKALGLLKSQGRLVVISFHSGEDKIVKNFLRKMKEEGRGKILTKKPVLPGKKEVEKNPRARSAKLRALEKI